MKTAKVSSKNQITIPRSALATLGLGKSRRVAIEVKRDGVLVRPLRTSVVADHYGYARETWRALGGGEKYLKGERNAWKK